MSALISAVFEHYSDVIIGAMVFQITNLTIVYSAVYSGAYQKKRQSPVWLVFVRAIHRWRRIPRTNGKTDSIRLFLLAMDIILNALYVVKFC